MTRQKNTPEYVTREILKEEISASEKRLGARIETTSQSFKEYTDSRLKKTDATVKELNRKMTKYFGLMMQTLIDGNKGVNKMLSNHEERITVLEGGGPQPGRI